LSRQGKFAWPIPEVLLILIGIVLLVFFPEDQYFDINTFGGMILASAVISLPIGIPLLLAKVGFSGSTSPMLSQAYWRTDTFLGCRMGHTLVKA
ncbi:hypothetical protein ACTXKO_13445, partial [Corynebacterium casei]